MTPSLQLDILKIITIPFVNAISSEYKTIFTVLVEVIDRCIAQNKSRIAVIYDPPIYQKAFEITYSSKETPKNKENNTFLLGLAVFNCSCLIWLQLAV